MKKDRQDELRPLPTVLAKVFSRRQRRDQTGLLMLMSFSIGVEKATKVETYPTMAYISVSLRTIPHLRSLSDVWTNPSLRWLIHMYFKLLNTVWERASYKWKRNDHQRGTSALNIKIVNSVEAPNNCHSVSSTTPTLTDKK